MSDDTYAKVAQAVIRLVASAIIMGCLFLYAADYLLYLTHKPLPSRGSLILTGLPILICTVLIIKSRALAEYFTRDMD